MPRILVSGALANKPGNGGNAWSRLSWLRGFQRFGFEVLFVEQLAAAADADAARSCFRETMAQFDLAGDSALLGPGLDALEGVSGPDLLRRATGADLLFNISGHLTQPDLFACTRRRIYYDDDPGFTQLWERERPGAARLAGHDQFVTLGANIGRPDGVIPTCGRTWIPTRPPVVLSDWPTQAPVAADRFTTVASWRGAYAPIVHAGTTFGVKAHEFRKVFDLPRRVPAAAFEIALQMDPADGRDREALLAHGWHLADPRTAAGTCEGFRRYVQDSFAEFSVAQGVYAGTRSGWFSDRTVRYLASGRPALIQDTGLRGLYPVGQGLLVFTTLEEAVEGAERILREPGLHARLARRLAEEYFDSDLVIRELLNRVGIQ